ncbi:Radical-activating enzyme, conserved site [Acididesulfobacillus acetoxydans]|uniref:Benzylsuccinate synthase activating enzyme n=1 Tax=Acididesulfobacillus acetoxydans TaxID=1561005 RepID=A0A8S0XCN1_9FIRM|nr:glycyl-radical enzyme activating protein [Acididesulfobacillus acetoxydans]CAA7602656.1 Radical-activating enzyme, conserved site [Acididesulfobacillus acetoxydans]CEJ09129.1 Benzylsuccinate synthase activating enzyme [Acididesulfobacillus acetoxydans]
MNKPSLSKTLIREPLIIEIKRNALDDGPGIRTVVFFKGCPLSCVWCQNPEAINPEVEVMFSPGDCLHCDICQQACPTGALDLQRQPYPIDLANCQHCTVCVDPCPSQGLRRMGRVYTVEELIEEVLRDSAFYRNSGGGVTLSGGEATLYPDFQMRLLPILKQQGIHITLETCGYYQRPQFERHILPYLDLIFFDLKFADAGQHQRYTGKRNDLILANFRQLVKLSRIPVLPRIPLIPGITTTPENLQGIADFLRSENIHEVALLPYNPLWSEKAEHLGRVLTYQHSQWLSAEELSACSHYFTDFKIIYF